MSFEDVLREKVREVIIQSISEAEMQEKIDRFIAKEDRKVDKYIQQEYLKLHGWSKSTKLEQIIQRKIEAYVDEQFQKYLNTDEAKDFEARCSEAIRRDHRKISSARVT